MRKRHAVHKQCRYQSHEGDTMMWWETHCTCCGWKSNGVFRIGRKIRFFFHKCETRIHV